MKFRYSCKVSDKIIAISESTKNDLVHFFGVDPNKIEVIYQACNPLFYKPPVQNQEELVRSEYRLPNEYILYVGSIEPRKNVKMLIGAYKAMSPGLRIPLVLIGRGGKYREECERMIIQAGLDTSVIRIDRLTDNRHLQVVYRMAAAMVYPSLYEGFGLPIVEALLSNTAVITSNVSAMPEAGGPNSLYFNPNDQDELTTQLERVISDSSLRAIMKEEGYRFATATFDPERLTHRVYDMYGALHKK